MNTTRERMAAYKAFRSLELEDSIVRLRGQLLEAINRFGCKKCGPTMCGICSRIFDKSERLLKETLNV